MPTRDVLYSPLPSRLFVPSYGEWNGGCAWKMMLACPTAIQGAVSEWGNIVPCSATEPGVGCGASAAEPGDSGRVCCATSVAEKTANTSASTGRRKAVQQRNTMTRLQICAGETPAGWGSRRHAARSSSVTRRRAMQLRATSSPQRTLGTRRLLGGVCHRQTPCGQARVRLEESVADSPPLCT